MEPENEVRYYLGLMEKCMKQEENRFVPTYLVVATKLENGAIDLSVSSSNIIEKIDEIFELYDEDMQLKTNPKVSIQNIMIV